MDNLYLLCIILNYFILTSLSGISEENAQSWPVMIAVKYVQQRATFASL